MAATMARFWEAERASGSVLRALKSERALGPRANPERSSGARYDKFFSLRGGMSTLTDRLAAALPSGTVRLRHRVSSVHRDASGWQVRLDADSGPQSCIYDAVVAAVPAAVGAEVLPANVALRLGRIESAGAAVICLGYAREQVHHPLDAFGLVMPHVEGRSILAVSFLSTKFAGRGPGGSVLVRVFVGGALQPEKLDLPDAQLTELATRELEDLLGVEGPPQAVEIARWRGAMPQYHVGHLRLVDEIEGAVASHPGLAVAGNAFRGVGVAHCVQSGEEAARRVLEFLDCREPAT
jgi:oxygen-dependent protoporphyrinogen oxidase